MNNIFKFIKKVVLSFLGFIAYGIVLIIIGLIITKIFPPKIEIFPSSNEMIIKRYTAQVRIFDSVFLYQVAEAFVETNYKGWLMYDFHSKSNHSLGGDGKTLTNKFPKIREIIKKKFPNARDSYFDIWYYNEVVFFTIKPSLFNQNENPIVLLYSKDVDNIREILPQYIIYENKMPEENDRWLYNFNKFWYVCSPREKLYYYRLDNKE
ncbi:MAG: hypothetical protein MJ211_15980 [Bacteroidales bacterium]|nr:hypothetical protein [Bacteroidales bacterium]